jgi:hypothetical protein
MLQMTTTIYIFILLTYPCEALVGYDCGTPFSNGTIVSLLEFGDCKALEKAPALSDVLIELLQKPRITAVDVLRCRIEIDNLIDDTGYEKFDAEQVFESERHYLPVDLSSCMYMHAYGSIQLGNHSLNGLSADTTNSRIMPLTESNQAARPSVPSRVTIGPYLIARRYVHITFGVRTVKLDLLVNKLHLPTGTICAYSDLECTDEEGYQNYWSPLFHKGCQPLPYSIIYRGPARKMQLPGYPTGYTVSHNSTQVILLVRTRHDACNSTVLQSEHPQLVVREIKSNLKPVDKLHSHSHFNSSSYIIIENKSEINVESTYSTISLQRCLKEKAGLHSALTLAYQDPRLFAFTLTGSPGYSAYIRGEAAYLFRCTAVPTQRRQTGSCFQELPVIVNNKPMYLLPRTRVITTKGTETPCGPSTSAMYRHGDQWYEYSPRSKKAATRPEILQPNTLPWGHKPGWHLPDSIGGDTTGSTVKEETSSEKPARSQAALEKSTIVWTAICLAALSAIVALYIVPKYRQSRKLKQRKAIIVGDNSFLHCEHIQQLRRSTRSTINNQESSQANLLNVSPEIAAIRKAYQHLEDRINKCIPAIRQDRLD